MDLVMVEALALRLYGQIGINNAGFPGTCLCEALDLVDELLEALGISETERLDACKRAVEEADDLAQRVDELVATR